MTIYDDEFYGRHRSGSRNSAEVIVPIIIELVSPKSVVDVGCGIGTWLSVFEKSGIRDFLGLDGDYINPQQLLISLSQFRAVDLAKPFEVGRKYDLAISLEVAEHLPEQAAGAFVDLLTRLAPVVFFSAAIPFQGGTGHINEQWPGYWARHFARNDFVAIDVVRPKVWDNERVEFWYAQNALIFASRECTASKLPLRYDRKESESPLARSPRRGRTPRECGPSRPQKTAGALPWREPPGPEIRGSFACVRPFTPSLIMSVRMASRETETEGHDRTDIRRNHISDGCNETSLLGNV